MLLRMATIRTGVFGGTFNPIHYGHLMMAEDAREAFALDEVIWVPAGLPPHKRDADLVSSEHRYALIERAIEGHPAFRISDIEMRRPGPSYTVDTLRQLQQDLPGRDWHFIIGADTLLELHAWKDIASLLGLCRFIPVARPGTSREIRAEDLSLPAPAARQLVNDLVAGHLVGISSTEIRQRVRTGRSIRYLVPPAVAAYIAERHLYQPEAVPSKP